MNTTNIGNLLFHSTFDTMTTTDVNMFDPFEQYIDLSFATSPTPVNNLPLDFDQWFPSHPAVCAPLSVTADKTESTQLLFQDKPSLASDLSHLTQADPYDMTMHFSLTHSLPPATSQALRLLSPPQVFSEPSSSSFSLYEDALGLTWPTSEVSFEDFDVQDLSFLNIPFTTTTDAKSTTSIGPLLDFQFQPKDVLPSISDSMNNVMDSFGYLVPPLEPTTIPTTAPTMHLYPIPAQITQPPTQLVPVLSSSSNPVIPFRSMSNVSNLFLPQMDTSTTLPPGHLSETAPQNLPLLWSTFPPTQSMPSPPSLPSQSALPTLPPAKVLPAVVAHLTPVQPVQDMIICKDYSPTEFVLDSSMVAKKLASRRRQSVQSVDSAFAATATLSRRSSVSTPSVTMGVRLSPYARFRYPQEPKKRQSSGLRDENEDEDNDSDGVNCLKWQKTIELSGSTKITPNYLALFDASQCRHKQPLFTPSPSPPSYSQNSQQQSPPAPPTSKTKTKTTSTNATSIAPNKQKIKPKGKSGRKPTLKKITDCAHYRPRNAFFMFRGFVSHIHTYLYAKQLSSSSLPFNYSVFDSSATSSCSMTSTRPSNSHNISGNDSDDSTTSSPNFPTPHSDTQCQQQRPHLSLSLPPTTSTTIQSSPSPSPTQSPTPPRRRTRQAQTKVSVSCGKIWSSLCLATCKPRSTGCANCRMRSLFRQASDYLKLRQTEIERLIEFPLPSNKDDGERGMIGGGRERILSLENSFNWKEFEVLYSESDLFKWHREYFVSNDNDDNEYENGKEDEMVLDVEEMKAIWMENELAYEKAFSEGARKRLTQEGLKAATGVANSSCSNKRTAAPIVHKE